MFLLLISIGVNFRGNMKKSKKKTKSKKKKKLFIVGTTFLGTVGLTAFISLRENTPVSIHENIAEASNSVSADSSANHTKFDDASLLVQSEPVSLQSQTFDDLSKNTEALSKNALLVNARDTAECPSPQINKYPRKDFSYFFEIGGNYTRVNMQTESGNSYSGNLGGAQGGFEYKPLKSFYEGLLVTWKQGHMDGSYSTNRSLLYIDVQERFGYTAGNARCAFTFFTGFGYRHYGQTLHAHAGREVEFEYNEFYVPVGLATDFALNPWFSIGINGTWMPQVYPTVAIGPLQGARWKLTTTMNNYSVEVPISFAVSESKKCRIILNPFYERWKDGHTTAETSIGRSLGLPGNTYNFWGGEVNVLYSF